MNTWSGRPHVNIVLPVGETADSSTLLIVTIISPNVPYDRLISSSIYCTSSSTIRLLVLL